MKKRRKLEVGTWYAVRDTKTGLYYPDQLNPASPGRLVGMIGGQGVPFVRAALMPKRPRVGKPLEVVPVRCRPLTSKKRNPRRTR